MSRLGTLGHKLYTGQASYEFVGSWRRWLALSSVVILVGLIGLATRGLSLSLEFKGGTQFTFPDKGSTRSQVGDEDCRRCRCAEPGRREALERRSSASRTTRCRRKPLTTDEITKVTDAITSKLQVTKQQVSLDTVGSSWGSQITHKAVESLIIFLARDRRVPVAALRVEDGRRGDHCADPRPDHHRRASMRWSASTCRRRPSSDLLTILGYSLYDTVVVFDKVRENTAPIAGGSRYTYAEAANLAVNQTLVRSINTSIIALLPVASLLFVGAGLLGAGSLKDLALALFIGLATGSYSSIFIATPLLVLFKEREPQYIALTKRVSARVGSATRSANLAATAAAGGGSDQRRRRAARRPPSIDRPLPDEPLSAAAPEPVDPPRQLGLRPLARRRHRPASRHATATTGRAAVGQEAAAMNAGERRGADSRASSATSPTTRAPASCSRTSRRCSPTPRPSRRSSTRWSNSTPPAASTRSSGSKRAGSSSPRRSPIT